MKSKLSFILIFIIPGIMLLSCSPTSTLYTTENKARLFTGQLHDSVYTILKQFLNEHSNVNLKDTIVIKYDYNNETCWNNLDLKDDDYIKSFISTHQTRVNTITMRRQDVSFFEFREIGNNLNKLKKWDSNILIDSSRKLFGLLFKERCTCGSSIIILPNRKYVFLRSDAHSEAFDLTQEKIEGLFK